LTAFVRRVLCTSFIVLGGCSFHHGGHTINFESVLQADHLVVNRGTEVVKTITDPDMVQVAARFVQPYSAGWEDPLRGPLIPRFTLYFYNGSRFVKAYGIGIGYLASYSPADGFWSRDVPEANVRHLAETLGLDLDDKRPYR
jgi:hypothetical protein